MVMELTVNGVAVADRPRLYPRVDDAARAEELLGWAIFLDGGGVSAHGELRKARTLAEAADFEVGLVDRAWQLGLGRLEDGATTRSVVDLLCRALAVIRGVAATP